MPIAVELNFKGATLEQYDRVVQKMDHRPGGPGPVGALFHWVTKTPDGIRVTDVWESKEIFEKFSREEIGPITQQVGFPGAPEVQFFEVHNYHTAG